MKGGVGGKGVPFVEKFGKQIVRSTSARSAQLLVLLSHATNMANTINNILKHDALNS